MRDSRKTNLRTPTQLERLFMVNALIYPCIMVVYPFKTPA